MCPSPFVLITSPGLELLAVDGRPVERAGTIPAAEVPGLRPHPAGIWAVGAGFPHGVLSALGVTPPVATHCDVSDAERRGRAAMASISGAVAAAKRNKAKVRQLRRLARWLPAVFFNHPDAVAFLSTQSDARKSGFLRLQKSRGRPDDTDTALRDLSAIRALLDALPGVTAKKACAEVKRSLPRGVDSPHLRNLHSQFGGVVEALIYGYRVPAEQLTEYAWPFGPDAQFNVYR